MSPPARTINKTPLNKHSLLFDNSMGCLKGMQLKLNLKEGTTPKFHKVRSVPYALREPREQELDNLVEKGFLKRLNIVNGLPQLCQF